MESCYIKARNAVIKKLGRDNEYFPLVTLGLCALLYKYKEHEKDVLDLFNRMDLYLDNNDVNSIIKKNNIKRLEFDEEYEDILNEHSIICSGLSNSGKFCDYSKGRAIPVYTNPVLICECSFSSFRTLNNFLHEFNHLVKSIDNGFEIYNEEDRIGYSVRTGVEMNTTLFCPETRSTIEIIDFSTLDEAINVCEVTEMTESLLMLDGLIPDSDVNSYYNYLDKDKMIKDVGYDEIVKLFRPLWENDVFHNLIEDNIYSGNFSEIINSFENIMGEDTFEDFANLLDDYDDEVSMYDNPKKKKQLKLKINKFINNFNNLTNFVYKK